VGFGAVRLYPSYIWLLKHNFLRTPQLAAGWLIIGYFKNGLAAADLYPRICSLGTSGIIS
jgi:hypothetical protein